MEKKKPNKPKPNSNAEKRNEEEKKGATDTEPFDESKYPHPFKKSGINRTPPDMNIASTSTIIGQSGEVGSELERSKRKREESGITSPAAIEKRARNPTQIIKKELDLEREIQEVELGEEASETDTQIGDESFIEEKFIEISSDEDERNKLGRREVDQITAEWESEDAQNISEEEKLSSFQKMEKTFMELERTVKDTTNVKKRIHELIQIMGRYMEEAKIERNEEIIIQEREIWTSRNQDAETQTCNIQEHKSTQTKSNRLSEIKPNNTIENFKDLASYYWVEDCYQRTTASELSIESFPPEYVIIKEEKKRNKHTGKIDDDYLIQHSNQEGEVGSVMRILNISEIENENEQVKKIERQLFILRTKAKETEMIKEEDLFKCLNELKKQLIRHKITKVVMNKIGGGGTKIAWGAVRKMIEYVFYDVEIDIVIAGMKKPKKNEEEDEERKDDLEVENEKNSVNKNNTRWSEILEGKTKDRRSKQKENKKTAKKKKTEAIIITTKNEQYANIVKRIKTKINPSEMGIGIKTIRKTRRGDVLIETNGEEDNKKLKRSIEGIQTGEEIRMIGEDYKRETIVINNIEEDTEKAEIIEAIKILTDREIHESIDIKALKIAHNNTMTAIIKIATKGAKQIMDHENGNIRIGWVMCRARKWVQLRQCNRCYKYDHATRNCKKNDQKEICNNCGEEGHKRKECTQQAKCSICNVAGHRVGTAKCPYHRKALEEARKESK